MIKGASHEVAILTAGDAGEMSAFAAVIDARTGEDGKPVRLRFLPMGTFAPRDARIKGFSIVDRAHADEIVAASQAYAGQQLMPIDYDHQTVYGAIPGVGGTAPAAGWVETASLMVEEDGIYGEVKWTPKAAQAIRDSEYRYLSPVINHDKSGRVTRLMNVGLTNSPAVDGLAKLAASLQPQQELHMDLTALAASLGLPATATLAQIMAAVEAQTAALSASQASVTALNQALGLAPTADQATALSAVTTLRSSDGTAAAALMITMQADLIRLSSERNERVVDDAIKAGKVTPGQKEHFVALMRTNEGTALALINAAAPVAGGLLDRKKPGEPITALSAEQREIAKQMGLSEDVVLAQLKIERDE